MKRGVWLSAALVAILAGVGLYGIGGLAGNRGASAACRETAAAAQRLDPLAEGEVAAFQIAREPQDLRTLAFTGPEGKPATLGDYAGKVALLNIWATWCAPCRLEMPALDRLQAAAGGADFSVVAVSIDTGGPEKPRAFLEEVGVKSLPFNSDPSTDIFDALVMRSLGRGLPITVLLDRNGCHLGLMNGPAEWDSEDGRRLIEGAVEATADEAAAGRIGRAPAPPGPAAADS